MLGSSVGEGTTACVETGVAAGAVAGVPQADNISMVSAKNIADFFKSNILSKLCKYKHYIFVNQLISPDA